MKVISLPEMQALALDIAHYYGLASESADGSYHCACPLHGGHDSLHVSASDRILAFCFGNIAGDCTYENLLARFKVDGFDVDVRCIDPKAQRKGDKAKKDTHGLKQNIPAHDQTPLNWHAMQLVDHLDDGSTERVPITHCFTYTNEKGEVIFYQLRADTNRLTKKGKKVKIIRPYSSIYNEETKLSTWDFSLIMPGKRPLYNLKEIADNPTKPVLLVEGEKTADVAKRLLPGYVVTTYSGGMGNWNKSDFTPLKGREVILWPDNSRAGIHNFLDAAAILDPAPKIVFGEQLKDRPENWDLADELPQDALTHEALLKNATIVRVAKVSADDPATIFDKYNQFLRVLAQGGTLTVYDKTKVTQDTWLPYSYLSFGDIAKIHPEKIQAVNRRGPRTIYAVEAWKDSADKIVTYGITYDPESRDELVVREGLLHTNKFLGFDHEAIACDPEKYKCFIDHITHIMDPVSAKYLINFIAHIVQQPKVKPGVLPILVGKQATGKTIIGKIIQAMLGWRNVLVTNGHTFNSKWNGQFSGKLLVVVDEYTTRDQNKDFMNTFITDTKISLEHKGKPITSEESYHRALGTTNDEDFDLSLDDRRYFPIQVYNPSIDSFNKPESNKAYYKHLDMLCLDEVGLQGLHYYFKNYKMDMDVQLVPQTEFRYAGMKPVNPVHCFILDICESGSMPEAFGLTYAETQDKPYTPQYPSKLLRKHVNKLMKDYYKFKGPSASRYLTPFIGPERLNTNSNVKMAFYRQGTPTHKEEDNDRVFELPHLDELRARYIKLVDPNRKWPPVLRVVKDDDDSPV